VKTIAIIYGGGATENDVSVESASYLLDILRSVYSVEMLRFTNVAHLVSELKRLRPAAALSIVYGCPGQDGLINGLLESIGIPYVGSALIASALTKNKAFAKTLATFKNICTPPWTTVDRGTDPSDACKIIENVGYPLIIKPNLNGGMSVAVSLCEDAGSCPAALQDVFAIDNEALVERFVAGDEFVTVVLECTERLHVFNPCQIQPSQTISTFQEKRAGRVLLFEPFLSKEETIILQRLSVTLFHTFGMRDFAYFEFIRDGEHFWFLEAGSIPGFTKRSTLPLLCQYWCYDLTCLIEILLENTITRYKPSRNIVNFPTKDAGIRSRPTRDD
jgi:D-alanine-D-alanine ligase